MKYFERIQKVGILCMLKKVKHILFPDNVTLEIAAGNGAYEYLQRYAYAFNKNRKSWNRKPKPKIIWTCWWQGMDNAPLLVKKCIASMQQYARDYEVRIIDSQNISQFIHIPNYIVEKYEKGIIPTAHFSDIIRLLLLKQYGGIWIDSTILLTGAMPDYILDADLFLFRYSRKPVGGIVSINPFIVACPNHPIIEDVLDLLLEYWKMENKLVAYTIMPLFFTMVVSNSALDNKLWDEVPWTFSNSIVYLGWAFSKKYDSKLYDIYTHLSSIHKLTYKFEQYGIDINKKGTFYDILINGNKP